MRYASTYLLCTWLQVRQETVAAGREEHHTTFEEPETTLKRIQLAGWEGATLNSAESLGLKYGVPKHSQAQILASK